MTAETEKLYPYPIEYEAPSLTILGSFHDLTLCDKIWGSSDGNTFMGGPIVCRSA